MRTLVFAAVLFATMPTLAVAQTGTPVVLTADTSQTTASGATFTAPTMWSVTAAAAVITLSPPEPDNHVAIVDIDQAADGADAVRQAWEQFRPGFERPTQLVTPRAARNGWDEALVVEYETSPNELTVVQAVARRGGSAWTVVLVDVTQAVAERRGAAFNLVLQSLRPAGYSRQSFAGRTANRLDAARIEELRSFLETSMAELGIPGVGFALYDQGRMVHEGGLGVREIGRPEPVDAHTLFMVASNTKGMTTLLLAKLVDEGRLRWDQRVTEIYPAFRLGSEATTEQVLIRHLVCACTGLPRNDYGWLFNTPLDTPPSAPFTQLAATQPTSGFGEIYQYNNQMAAAAGYIAGYLYHPELELGAAYDRAMQENIFSPLGMRDTTFDMARALAGNVASPHGDDLSATPRLLAMDMNYSVVPLRPSGGLWSSAHDMILYVANELREGRLPDGGRLVSEENLLARRARSVATGEDGFYGMGLQTSVIGDIPVVHHGGSMFGYKSDIMFVPEAGVGAVILTNADNGQMLLAPFRRRLMEVLYDGHPEAAADVSSRNAVSGAQLAEFGRRLTTPPAVEAARALADAYVHPELGDLRVRREGDAVVFQFASWSSPVASRLNDDGTISFITIEPGIMGAEFVVAEREGKRALIIRGGQHEYVFAERL